MTPIRKAHEEPADRWYKEMSEALGAWVSEYLRELSVAAEAEKPRMAESMACEFLGSSNERADRPAELIQVFRELPSADTLGLLDACALVTRDDDIARRAFVKEASKLRWLYSAPWQRLIGTAAATGAALGGIDEHAHSFWAVEFTQGADRYWTYVETDSDRSHLISALILGDPSTGPLARAGVEFQDAIAATAWAVTRPQLRGVSGRTEVLRPFIRFRMDQIGASMDASIPVATDADAIETGPVASDRGSTG